MVTRYYKRPKFRRNCMCRSKRDTCTYASFLQHSRSNGVAVEMSPLHTVCANVADTCCKPDHPACARCGFLRYKHWWARKKADVFVDHQVFTGIPVLTADDTLCIASDGCSRFVPLEQVACIRVCDSPCAY